jgi:hypothetical protein
MNQGSKAETIQVRKAKGTRIISRAKAVYGKPERTTYKSYV